MGAKDPSSGCAHRMIISSLQIAKKKKLTSSNTGAEDDSPITLLFHMRDAQLGQLDRVITPSARPCPGRRWKSATDKICASSIYPPASLKFFHTGVFDLGVDTEHSPCHGSIAVKDIRLSELLDDPRM